MNTSSSSSSFSKGISDVAPLLHHPQQQQMAYMGELFQHEALQHQTMMPQMPMVHHHSIQPEPTNALLEKFKMSKKRKQPMKYVVPDCKTKATVLKQNDGAVYFADIDKEAHKKFVRSRAESFQVSDQRSARLASTYASVITSSTTYFLERADRSLTEKQRVNFSIGGFSSSARESFPDAMAERIARATDILKRQALVQKLEEFKRLQSELEEVMSVAGDLQTQLLQTVTSSSDDQLLLEEPKLKRRKT